MNPTDTLILFVKGLFLLVGVIYFLFTLLVYNRINLMTNTLETKISPALRVFAIFYMAFSLLALVILLKMLS